MFSWTRISEFQWVDTPLHSDTFVSPNFLYIASMTSVSFHGNWCHKPSDSRNESNWTQLFWNDGQKQPWNFYTQELGNGYETTKWNEIRTWPLSPQWKRGLVDVPAQIQHSLLGGSSRIMLHKSVQPTKLSLFFSLSFTSTTLPGKLISSNLPLIYVQIIRKKEKEGSDLNKVEIYGLFKLVNGRKPKL